MIYLHLGIITAKIRTNVDHVAETGRRRRGLARFHGPSTVITVKVAVRAGGCSLFSLKTVINFESTGFFSLFALSPESERKGLRKYTGGVIVYLLVHLLSGAEIQLWMHKRLWPEGKGKHDGIYRTSYSNTETWKMFRQFYLIFSTYLLRVFLLYGC